MIALIGLMCMNPADATTCTQMLYNESFQTMEECEATGTTHVGGMTPWGLIVAFACVPNGEDA